MDAKLIEYTVISSYLVLLVTISIVFKRLSSNHSDYFRSGCRGKWWLVGASCFMTAFSSWTFTGAAGAAFEAGWSALIIFLANTIAFLINAAFLAPWFRQLRAISPPQIIRDRFGERSRQFYAWIMVGTQTCFSSVHLYALAIFSSAVFGYQVNHIIIVLGAIVLFYSMVGGSWGVMASDFIQSSVLMPMTILIAILCLVKLGGIDGFLSALRGKDFSSDYSMFKTTEQAVKFGYKYTVFWAVVMLVKNVTAFNSLTNAQRFFSVKDGREARKAALFTAVLMFIGSLIWFIPPMTARLLYADAVNAVNITKPAEASYAVCSMQLLPVGMTGLMVVAIFAATTSSMDSGLNRNAAVFTNDIYPAVTRMLGLKPTTDGRKLLFIGRIFTIFIGCCVISLAYYLSVRGKTGVFQYMLNIGGMLMVPMMIPMLLGLFFRRVPHWSCVFATVCAFSTSAIGALSGSEYAVIQKFSILQEHWTWQTITMTNMVTATTAFLITGLFWSKATSAYRQQVKEFFTKMHTPIDFEKEVGESYDTKQYLMTGTICSVIALAICLLLFVKNAWTIQGRFGILFIAGFVGAVGMLLIWTGRRSAKKLTK